MLLYEIWNFDTADANVKHFEDLPAKDILEFTSQPTSFSCTEKLDGSNIMIGRDATGFYTRRVNKEKYYKVSDYETSFFTNYQKLALAAVLDTADTLQQFIEEGEEVGAEVLVNSQPNVVFYENNCDMATIVLFKDLEGETLDSRGRTEPIEFMSVEKRSFTKSRITEMKHRYRIRTIDNYQHEIPTHNITSLQILLCAKQDIAGLTLPVYEIIDWPLNRKHPGDFDQPWKEVKEDFKKLRTQYRKLLKKLKTELMPKCEHSYKIFVSEGFVCTSGDVEFKLVEQEVFLEAKNFIWKFRDALKALRKEAGDLNTLDQVEHLRSQYLDLKDKYEVEQKDQIQVTGASGTDYSCHRTSCVTLRDRSAFVTAFEELSRIESEIRRNNRNA